MNPHPIPPGLKELPSGSFLRQSQLIPHLIPISAATLWRMVQDGRFPRPVKLGPRITAWRVEDVCAWSEARHG